MDDWLEDSLSLATMSSSSGKLVVLAPPTSSGVPLSQAAFKTGQSGDCVPESVHAFVWTPFVNPGGWLIPWSAEEMLEG